MTGRTCDALLFFTLIYHQDVYTGQSTTPYGCTDSEKTEDKF